MPASVVVFVHEAVPSLKLTCDVTGELPLYPALARIVIVANQSNEAVNDVAAAGTVNVHVALVLPLHGVPDHETSRPLLSVVAAVSVTVEPYGNIPLQVDPLQLIPAGEDVIELSVSV